MLKGNSKTLISCLIIAAAFLCTSLLATGMNEEGTPILVKKSNSTVGSNKDDVGITAYINGHTLTVNFAQNIGSVLVEISDGQSFMVVTPDTAQAYITSSGSYTVNFTLPGGDEYYGNFVVN